MLTDEHEHAMKVWWEACAAYEDGAATDTSQPVRGMAIAGDQAAAAAVIAADRAGLVAEVERLREALTPNADTKAAYLGEFQFNIEYIDEDGGSYWEPHLVPWTTIKEIMAAISARSALKDTRHDADA